MPNRVELTQEYAYVVNSGDNNVQKINLQTGATEALIFIGLSTNPYDIIIEGDFAYVSGGMSNKVYKIDLNTDEVVGSVNVGSNPAGMAVIDGKLYVGNTDYANYYANCSVSIINLQTFSVINTIPTEVNPQFLAVINDEIHISCGGDWGSITGKICVLDPDTEEITEIVEIGGVTSNFAVTPNDVVYVGDGFGYSLFAYDAEDYSIIYGGSNPFTPGGTMVATNEENLFVLGGEWGQNFSVKKYDFEENLLAEYTVALYATDLKLLPENTSGTNDQLPVTSYQLSNYPNPFNPSTTITFSLTTELTSLRQGYAGQAESTEIEIYNIKGERIRTFSNLQITQSPNHQITWDGTDQTSKLVSSGVYLYRLKVDGKVAQTRRMLMVK